MSHLTGQSMYEVGQEMEPSLRQKLGQRASGVNSRKLEAVDVLHFTAGQLKTALLLQDLDSKIYIEAVRTQLGDYPEACAHVVNQLSFTKVPAFLFSLTTTLELHKAEVLMVGRGGMLFRNVTACGVGPSKQYATQQAYVAFVDQLCAQVLRGPSLGDKAMQALRRVFLRGKPRLKFPRP